MGLKFDSGVRTDSTVEHFDEDDYMEARLHCCLEMTLV